MTAKRQVRSGVSISGLAYCTATQDLRLISILMLIYQSCGCTKSEDFQELAREISQLAGLEGGVLARLVCSGLKATCTRGQLQGSMSHGMVGQILGQLHSLYTEAFQSRGCNLGDMPPSLPSSAFPNAA